jgi:hypothetical protein
MNINIEFNRKSIKEAIKTLQKQKKILSEQVIPEFMLRSAEWIKLRANEILNGSDIGVQIVQNITSSWHIDVISNSHIVLYNMSWKSAYVEFGVGIIGQTSKHPNADKTGYEYDVTSEYKFGQGFWKFNVEDSSWLDIPQDAIIYEEFTEAGQSIITQGTQGLWYLFNAVEDFKLTKEKPLWQEIKEKYWS